MLISCLRRFCKNTDCSASESVKKMESEVFAFYGRLRTRQEHIFGNIQLNCIYILDT